MPKAKPQSTVNNFQKQAKKLLESTWVTVLALKDIDKHRGVDGDKIYHVLANSGLTYPYILLTQVLGKATDPTLDALCLQKGDGAAGAWDARSLARLVVYPWNKVTGSPFKGSNEDPYVNNPGRYDSIGAAMRMKNKNKANFDKLRDLVEGADTGVVAANSLLRDILIETRRLQNSRTHSFVGPVAASLDEIMVALESFIATRSSGVRLQAACVALFETLKLSVAIADKIKSRAVNASDKATSQVGDVELVKGGKVILAVEVKDKFVKESDVTVTIQKARKNGVTDVVFLIRSGKPSVAEDEAFGRAAAEFAKGISVNLLDAMAFIKNTLALLSTKERSMFLRHLHETLETQSVDFTHVKAWSDLMAAM
jgi:hypothetical protein